MRTRRADGFAGGAAGDRHPCVGVSVAVDDPAHDRPDTHLRRAALALRVLTRWRLLRAGPRG